MARLIEVLVEYEAPCSPKDLSVLAADKVMHLAERYDWRSGWGSRL
jgi:hypothetical protein